MSASASREVLNRVLGLLRRPTTWIGGVPMVASAALTRLRLLEAPGYDLALVLTVLVALVGGGLAIAAGRQEQRLVAGRDPRPSGALRADSPLGAVGLAFTTSFVLLLLLLLPATATSVIRAAVSTRCDPFRGLPFLAILPLPAAFFTSAVGVFAAFAGSSRKVAAAVYVAALLASVALTAWPLWSGPQVFAFNAFGAWFPGPIYDENLAIGGSLIAHQGVAALGALGIVGVAAWLLDFRTGVFGLPHLWRPGSILLVALAVAGVTAAVRGEFALGLRTPRVDLEKALGGRRTSKHFAIHYPAGKPRPEVERLERDLEFRFSQLEAFFGVAPARPVLAYVYRNAAEKRRLVGATDTSFAKPWRLELHVGDAPFPNPVIRHELAHVFGASFGSPLFRASARSVVLINAGIVEGMATAADDTADELTLHQWARAMRELKLAPDVRAIVGPQGFFAESGPRAYTIAGSFVRWLAETRGPDKLRALYPEGDFVRAYGEPLGALAVGWEAFVDAQPLDERGRHLAQVRFERGSLFARECVREVAALTDEAHRVAASDPDRALDLYRRCAAIEPQVAAHRRGEADALWRKRDLSGAAAVLQGLLAEPELAPSARAEALMTLGDIAWERKEAAGAKATYEQVLALHRDRATDRTALAKLATLDDPVTGPAVFGLLLKGPSPGTLLRLREIVADRPAFALGWYLLGRQLALAGDHRRALPYLERAAAAQLPGEDFVVENLRLLAIARFHANDLAGMDAAFEELLKRVRTPTFEKLAKDWKDRAAFEKAVYGGSAVDEG